MKLYRAASIVFAGVLAFGLSSCAGNSNELNAEDASDVQSASESPASDDSEVLEFGDNEDKEYLQIDGQRLDVSQAGSDFLQNPLSAANYYGKQATVVSEVEEIAAPGYSEVVTRDNEKDPTEVYIFDNGCLFLEGGYIIDISDDMKSVASSLAKGDKVKASGVIEAFNNYGAVAFVDKENRFSRYDSTVIIEKVE